MWELGNKVIVMIDLITIQYGEGKMYVTSMKLIGMFQAEKWNF